MTIASQSRKPQIKHRFQHNGAHLAVVGDEWVSFLTKQGFTQIDQRPTQRLGRGCVIELTCEGHQGELFHKGSPKHSKKHKLTEDIRRQHKAECASEPKGLYGPLDKLKETAIAYCAWLAERDGIELPDFTRHTFLGDTLRRCRVHIEYVQGESGKREARAKAVTFHDSFPHEKPSVTIHIPHWDWVPSFKDVSNELPEVAEVSEVNHVSP